MILIRSSDPLIPSISKGNKTAAAKLCFWKYKKYKIQKSTTMDRDLTRREKEREVGAKISGVKLKSNPTLPTDEWIKIRLIQLN